MPPRKAKDKADIPEVSPRSTKAEVLDAYQQLAAQLRDVEVDTRQEEEQGQRRLELEKKHRVTTVDQVLKQLTDLKLTVNKAISEVTEGLVNRSEQLNELVKTVELEEKYLSEVEQIKVDVKSLKQLLLVQERQKLTFEKQMAQQRQTWEEELQQQERQKNLEDETFQYELKRKRRAEEEEYQFRKAEKEKVLVEREKVLKTAEEELKELREKSAKFDGQLAKAVDDVKKATTVQVERKAEIKSNLLKKEIEGDKKLSEAQIANLKEAVKQQTERVLALEKQLSQANDRIKEIAAGAVSWGKGRGEDEQRKSSQT